MTARLLGKQPYRHDARTLRLWHYLDPDRLPAAPAAFDQGAGITSWPMFANDRLGDCTAAGAAHAVQSWTHDAAGEVDLTDDAVIAFYSACSGYNPASGANDNGAVELDVLKQWRGAGIAGHRISSFVAVDPNDPSLNRTALWLAGGLYLGVQLPAAAQQMGTHWALPADMHSPLARPGSWGGHCVWATAYDATGVDIVSWGQIVRVDWAFFATYVDESWACLSPDFLTTSGASPEGFNTAQLAADLDAISEH